MTESKVVGIVDYGCGNIGSISNMLRRVGVTATVISDPNDLDGTSAVILPGVGHFDNCARNLRRKGFASALEDIVLRQQVPLLGICVGAQLLTRGSEEGDELGLGWVQAITVRFMPPVHSALKVPHMGWNTVEPVQSVELFESDGTRPRFYFVHSYFIRCDDRKSILCSTNYGGEFASGVQRGHIFGVQFHPEKSHKFGLMFLRRWCAIKMYTQMDI